MVAEPIIVAAAVIERGGAYLATQRLPGRHLEGYWEFPGGKCERGERPIDCLRREILEELGAEVDVERLVLSTRFSYPGKTVELHFYRCTLLGDPRPLLGQAIRWVPAQELGSLRFPEADRELIALLAAGET